MAGKNDTTTDAALIQEVAARRDAGAFETLAQRHAQALYSTAWHITGEHQAAEDAVQEALLDFWRCVETYQPRQNSARSWLCSIAAHKALKLKEKIRKTGRLRAKVSQAQGGPDLACVQPAAMLPEHTAPEKEETLIALRGLLGRLPIADRRMVALYYSAGFTQQKIARAMRLPQRTVSARLAHALRWLQTGMAESGFAALLPGDELLPEALRSAPPPPGGLARAWAFAAPEKGLESQGPAAGTTPWGVKPVMLACGAAVVAAWALYVFGPAWSGPRLGPTVKTPEGALAAAPESTSGSQPASARFKRLWDFDSPGQFPDRAAPGAGAALARPERGARSPGALLAPGWGSVAQVQGKGAGQGGCLAFGAGGGEIRLGLGAARFPLRVSFKARYLEKGEHGIIGLGISGVSACGNFENVSRPLPARLRSDWLAWNKADLFITAVSMDLWIADCGRRGVSFFPAPSDGPSLSLGSPVPLLLDDLTLEEIDPAAAPDLSDFTREYSRLTPLARPGLAIPVPALDRRDDPAMKFAFRLAPGPRAP